MSKCLWCHDRVDTPMTFSKLFIEKPANLAQGTMCSSCYLALDPVFATSQKCISCCKRSEKEQCQDCLAWKQCYPDYPFRHESLFYYNSFAKEYMEKYKIMGDCELSLLFSSELKNHFKGKVGKSIVIPIPVSEKSQSARGFNQVELLLESAGVPYLKALSHIGEGEKQARKNRSERMEMKQPFIVDQEMIPQLKGASVILADDLYTTGRTLFHAADALKCCSLGSLETFSLFR